ncbi:MAG TPA: hypothetical protein VGO46_05430 [Gemmatimonadaceae bacterium]|jgi:hypothetical protein|nr:hypothetical protein [Gemmatimonadaceae bacterium]
MPTKKTKSSKAAAKTKSPAVKRKSATAKAAAPKPAKPRSAPAAPRAAIAGATPGSVVRERVIDIFANVCGKKPSEVDGPKLSELTARCDVPFRAQIASAVNAEFNDLLQPYGSDNISCSATVSTLSMQIIRDQA